MNSRLEPFSFTAIFEILNRINGIKANDFRVSEFLYLDGVARTKEINNNIKCNVHKNVEKG